MSEQRFEVGQKVICTAGGRARTRKLATVKRVLKRFAELDDGSKWYHFGSPWPQRPGFHYSGKIESATPELIAEVAEENERRRLLKRIDRRLPVLGKLPTPRLLAILEHMEAEEGAR